MWAENETLESSPSTACYPNVFITARRGRQEKKNAGTPAGLPKKTDPKKEGKEFREDSEITSPDSQGQKKIM